MLREIKDRKRGSAKRKEPTPQTIVLTSRDVRSRAVANQNVTGVITPEIMSLLSHSHSFKPSLRQHDQLLLEGEIAYSATCLSRQSRTQPISGLALEDGRLVIGSSPMSFLLAEREISGIIRCQRLGIPTGLEEEASSTRLTSHEARLGLRILLGRERDHDLVSDSQTARDLFKVFRHIHLNLLLHHDGEDWRPDRIVTLMAINEIVRGILEGHDEAREMADSRDLNVSDMIRFANQDRTDTSKAEMDRLLDLPQGWSNTRRPCFRNKQMIISHHSKEKKTLIYWLSALEPSRLMREYKRKSNLPTYQIGGEILEQWIASGPSEMQWIDPVELGAMPV